MLEIVLKKNVFDVDDNVNVIQIKKTFLDIPAF